MRLILSEIVSLLVAMAHMKLGAMDGTWVIPVLVMNMFICVLATFYNADYLPSVRRNKTSDLYKQMHFDQYPGFPYYPCMDL